VLLELFHILYIESKHTHSRLLYVNQLMLHMVVALLALLFFFLFYQKYLSSLILSSLS